MLDANRDLKVIDFGFAVDAAGRDNSGVARSYKGTPTYMSPEVHARQGYNPMEHDMFGIAVILFVMRSAAIPFNKATVQDVHYKRLIDSRSDLFWQHHESSKGAGYYSEEFKDLVTRMMQYNVGSRLSLAEIVGHPWLQGPTSTREDIMNEFSQR
jgi:serine/threonine protein kinase